MKKLIRTLVLLTVLLFIARPAHAWQGSTDGRVIIGQNFTLRSGEQVNGDLVVIGGQATVENTANVSGDIVVIGGSLQLDGEISGNAVVIGGLVSLGSQSSVAGDLVAVGGTVQRAEGARIGGNLVTNFPPPTLPLPNAAIKQVPASPPPPRIDFDFGPLVNAAGVFFQALGLAALAMLLTVFLHPQLDRVGQAVVAQPFIAGSIGLLTIVFAAITVVILSVTLILIPVALAAVLLLVLAWLFGVVAFGMEVGDRFTRAIHRSWEPVLSAGFGTFILAVVVGTIQLVPCVGWLAPVLVGFMGLGAAVITMFGTRSISRPTSAAAALDNAPAGGTPLPPTS